MAGGAERRRSGSNRKVYTIVESKEFRSIYSDGVFLSAIVDDNGASVRVLFTRIDLQIEEESFPYNNVEGKIVPAGPSQLKSTEKKVIEGSVIMRPDHAMNVAVGILNQLASLPETHKKMYKIPSIETSQLPRHQ